MHICHDLGNGARMQLRASQLGLTDEAACAVVERTRQDQCQLNMLASVIYVLAVKLRDVEPAGRS